ncbi:unnamed protein product [Pedinophyceae sp. YPF-701]|nr:unnamed protein product [Pedinophyceae sp. YPF-701]
MARREKAAAIEAPPGRRARARPAVKKEDDGGCCDNGFEKSPKRARVAGKKDEGDAKVGFGDTPVTAPLELAATEAKPAAWTVAVKYTGPFEDFSGPSAEECVAATAALVDLHGAPVRPAAKPGASTDYPHNDEAVGSKTILEKKYPPSESPVLDSLVRTILSQNTTDINSLRAFKQLKKDFPTWDKFLNARDSACEDSIRCGGLAQIKVGRIKHILRTLQAERGALSLEYLNAMSTEDARAELERFPGVGPKTVACTLMFALNRPEFPVDTHVWRIAKNQGWAPNRASREETYEHMNCKVPDEVKFDLHVLLVEHGKTCPRCAKNGNNRKESVGKCPLTPASLAKWREVVAAGDSRYSPGCHL